MKDLAALNGTYRKLRQRYSDRDNRMQQVAMIRAGRMSDIAPDLFPEDGPFQEPIVANMIDVAARDLSEMIAPLPAFNCSSPNMSTDAAQKRADNRTKILASITQASDLQTQLYTAADRYVTFGWMFSKVEFDFVTNTTLIRMLDPIGTYPVLDRYNRCTEIFNVVYASVDEIAELYPEIRPLLKERLEKQGEAGDLMEVVFHHDRHADTAFLPAGGWDQGVKLSSVPNLVGKCLANVARRPGPTTRGQFDDVIFVQLARSRFALLSLEAAHKSVQAPIVVPPDVTNVPIGPDAHLRTSDPAAVRRLPLEVPSNVWAEQAALEQELRAGTRYPELRQGSVSAGGHVTGRGVQALMDGFDTQVRTAQAIIAPFLTATCSTALEAEEKVFGNREKTIKGTANGAPFQMTYRPKQAIDGMYDVDVQYGLMAGLDPSRWLVFGLQARAEKLISRDYLRRQMPADLDASEEERKVDVEDMREALKTAVQAYGQAIPQMASQGQDPMQVIEVLTAVVDGRRKGKPIEQILQDAMAQEQPEAQEDPMAAMQEGLAGEAAPDMGMGGGPTGNFQQDMQRLAAGFGASGKPNMTAQVQRQIPM